MPTLHLAWTVDDGPTRFEDDMISVFASAGSKPIPVTWYIVWDHLDKFPAALKKYKTLVEKSGHEIGLHGVSATANHIKWFPTHDDEAPAYRTVKEAIEGIASFQNHLTKQGIPVKFVRAPTGLVSELASYLKKLNYKGVSDQEIKETSSKLKELKNRIRTTQADLSSAKTPEKKQTLQTKLNEAEAEQARLQELRKAQACNPLPGTLAHLIINDKNCNKTDPTVEKVALDYATLCEGLKRQNLKLWGGDATGKVSAQSWKAESSGVKSRTDNVPALINKDIDQLAKGSRDSASFVILCHSTTSADVNEVRKDIKDLESYAAKNGVKIVYHTMTSLYKQVVGKDP